MACHVELQQPYDRSQGEIGCHHHWKKFTGTKEHETRPFKGTRISFILFTHNACEELTPETVTKLQELGLTAAGSSRQRDPGALAEEDFDQAFGRHRKECPPPNGAGMVAVECAGWACGRGIAWLSFDTGAKAAAAADGHPAGAAPASNEKQAAIALMGIKGAKSDKTVLNDTVQVHTFPKNRVGFHVSELMLDPTGFLKLVANRRFDFYGRDQAMDDFALWVGSLKRGTVVLIAISDTAIAKTRPMREPVYKALQQLGAAKDIEVIGYRNPFVFIGAKGLSCGEAHMLLDKRSQSKTVLRLDARVGVGSKGLVKITDVKDSTITASDMGARVLTSRELRDQGVKVT